MHDGIAGLYGGMDMAKVMFGREAMRVPTHFWVQGAGQGMVSFVGVSKIPDLADMHPLHFGSTRTHQLVLADLIVVPRHVVATDTYRGHGLAALITTSPTSEEMLASGEVVMYDGHR